MLFFDNDSYLNLLPRTNKLRLNIQGENYNNIKNLWQYILERFNARIL
jgi:hypothetical protein